ncbi:uncharacterized protein JCM6883_004788 [Sporobolomyces salmoneus]|uniref:uncharacterized protein n=1 Tax=Sporobolomyces salmoneus TaxID=183962 RepID=UPI0031714036
MDRLPVELLRMIAEGPCPALKSHQDVLHNLPPPHLPQSRPWKRKNGQEMDSKLFLARQPLLRFRRYKSPVEKMEDKEFPSWERHLKPVDELLPPINNLALSTFFFRDLTSITVSPKFPLPDDFIVSLFGPFGSNRSILRQYTVEKNYGPESFLFEAYSRMAWAFFGLDNDELPDLIATLSQIEPRCEPIRRRKEQEEEGDFIVTDDEYNTIVTIVEDLAPSNYNLSQLMVLETTFPQEILPEILRTRDVPCHPFEALQDLTIHISFTWELYLIFYSRLFPVLGCLTLVGGFGLNDEIGPPDTLPHDVKVLRHAITTQVLSSLVPRFSKVTDADFDQSTDVAGKSSPPQIYALVLARHPNLFDSWDPLTQDEMESEPKIDYIGPNLTRLDMSRCSIVPQESE